MIAKISKMSCFISCHLFKSPPSRHFLRTFQTAKKNFAKCQSYSTCEKTHKTLMLFDCDGTLTKPKGLIHPDMEKYIYQNLRKRCTMGIVTGSDIISIGKQLGGDSNLNHFKYVFTENGLIAHIDGKLVAKQSILQHFGEERIQAIINYCLRYMSELKLPCKRGHFIDFRSGIINICPAGQSCSPSEKELFKVFDKQHGIRKKFAEDIINNFKSFGVSCAIGGQTSMDLFPVGWDKRFCLQFIGNHLYDDIHFFGDQTQKGGNDHELYNDPRVVGHSVTSPEDTLKQLQELFPTYEE